MPAVSIKVELDDKGVQQGTQQIDQRFQQLDANLQRVGQRGNVVLTQLAQKEQEVAQAAQQAGDAGVAAMDGMAGGAEAAVASFAGLLPILGLVAAFAVAHKQDISDWIDRMRGYTEAVKDAYDAEVKLNNKTFLSPTNQADAHSRLNEVTSRIQELNQAHQEATDVLNAPDSGGIERINAARQLNVLDAELIAKKEQQTKLEEELNKLAEDTNAKAIKYEDDIAKAAEDSSKRAAAAAEQAARKREAALKSLVTLGDQWAGKGLSQGETVDHSFVMAYQHALEEAQKSGASQEQVQSSLTQIIAGYARERGEIADKEADKAMSASERAAKQRQADEAKVTAAVQRQTEARERLDATAEAANEQAVALRVPVWQRGLAQIEVEHTRAMERIRRESEKLPADDASVLDARNAEWARYDAALADEHRQMVDQLGQDLDSWAQSITDGSFFDRILAEFRKFVFKMVASWLLGMQDIRGGASGQGSGSLLGAIFGSMTGAGGGGMATTPSFNGTAVGGSSGGSVIPGLPGLGGILTGGGGGSSAPFIAGNGGSVPDTRPPFDIFGQATGAISSGGGAKLNLKGLAGLGGALISTGLGGKAGSIGSLLTSLSMTDKLKGTNLGKLLGYAGIGVSGVGIGMNTGKLVGTLGGAAQGALSGFMIGGPIGAAIGGIIGGLSGLFGGFLGGSNREHQASVLAGQVEGQIQQIENAYKSHQMDYGSAESALTQLQNDANTQFDQLKGEGRSAWAHRVQPDFAKAFTEIDQFESERQRRTGLVFSAPQFATGGYVGGSRISGWRMSSGEVAAVIHEGEYVVNKNATSKNRAALENINAGGSGSGGGDTINMSFVDASGFETMLLKYGGWEGLKSASKKMKREGKGL